MTDWELKPRWAPRVPQHYIRRLYELDAQGIIDERLIDEVGYRLYDRCKSILIVRDIWAERRLPCPRCAATIAVADELWSTGKGMLCCDHCCWSLPWAGYYATIRHQELGAGGAAELFAHFMREWETAHTPRAKLLLIDRLIHTWHWETRQQRPRFGLGRPTGVNLIEGSRRSVLALLDQLTYGAASSAGTLATKQRWRERWQEVRARQAAARLRKQSRPPATGTEVGETE